MTLVGAWHGSAMRHMYLVTPIGTGILLLVVSIGTAILLLVVSICLSYLGARGKEDELERAGLLDGHVGTLGHT